MRGGVFPARLSQADARELIDAEPQMNGRDLAREVTPERPTVLAAQADGPLIAMIDTGVKLSILANLRVRGATVELHPCTASAGELLRLGPGCDLPRQRPGRSGRARLHRRHDQAARGEAARVRDSASATSCSARGRPRDLQASVRPHGATTGPGSCHRPTEITSQNHGFAVLGPGGARTIEGDEAVRWETDFGAAELTHINLYDRTVEGLTLRDVQGATVQYHPEAGPGPHDALYLFDRFVDEIKAAA